MASAHTALAHHTIHSNARLAEATARKEGMDISAVSWAHNARSSAGGSATTADVTATRCGPSRQAFTTPSGITITSGTTFFRNQASTLERKLLIAATDAVLLLERHRHLARRDHADLSMLPLQVRHTVDKVSRSFLIVPVIAGIVDHGNEASRCSKARGTRTEVVARNKREPRSFLEGSVS